MSRPVIGLCAAVEQIQYRVWEAEATFLHRAYSDAVQRAGAIAFLLPPDDVLAERPAEVLDHLDGLLLAGGADIDPLTYGAQPHPSQQRSDPRRDRFEVALAWAALERDLPLLGICRGMQLLNVATGGTLTQHIPETLASDRHCVVPGQYADHEVRLEPGSLAERACGDERVAVRSHHHQAAEALGEGLVATGWSVDDDLVEAIELPERRFALGVLWHPEEDRRSTVVSALVEEAADARSASPIARA